MSLDPSVPVLIRADGEIDEFRPAGDSFTLDELQGAVGGYVEVVPMQPAHLVAMNEDGLLRGLPANAVASALLARQIVGDVVVLPSELLD